MRKAINLIFIGMLLVSLIGFVDASGNHEGTFAEAEEIIKEKIVCDNLTDNQLEILGDYYMEQMHPGEAHEFMDDMMGGEGSESLRQIHINMGRAFYCGEHDSMSGGMMDTMMGRGGMMSSGGMMNNAFGTSEISGYNTNIFGWTFMILVIIILVLFIIWLIKQIGEK